MSTAPEARRSGVALRRGLRDALWGYAMIAPLCLGLAALYLGPALAAAATSLGDAGRFGEGVWVGLANYRALLADVELLRAIANTARFVALTVPVSLVWGLATALLLHSRPRGVAVYRALYLLPALTMPAASALIWRWLLNGDYGLLNGVLGVLGLPTLRYLTDAEVAPYAIAAVATWSIVGPTALVLESGLRRIPRHYYEAARLDGASALARLRHITLPLLAPTLFFAAVVTTLLAAQTFDLVLIMVGPTNPALASTQTVLYRLYVEAIVLGRSGYAAAMGTAFIAMTMGLLAPLLWRYSRREFQHGHE